MKLIAEYTESSNCDILVEEGYNGAPKVYKITGPYLEVDVRNDNGNRYPKQKIGNEIKRYIEQVVPSGAGYGELNHPHKPEVDMERIVHKILKMEYHGNSVIGTSKILDNEKGKVVKNFIDEKIPFGVSLRALGTFDDNKDMQEDFRMIAVDVVHQPGFSKAMMNFVLESKKEYFIDPKTGLVLESVNQLQQAVNDTKSIYHKENVIQALDNFWRSL